MAWIEGEQIRPVNQFVGINEELKKIRGYIDDDHEAKVLLYKFLRQNITFATDVIMGVKLFPFQHIAIKAMLDTDYTLNVWSRGLSKCGFWHSLVPTNRGLKRMKDVEVGDYILSKDGVNMVEDKVINPVEKTYKVTTSRGYESEGLDYHRVLTLTKDLDLEYKFSKDLKPGDCLVMRKGGVETNQIDIFKNFSPKKVRKDAIIINPSNLSIDEWYYFFGLLIGDGCFREEVISITSEDKEIEEFLIYFAKQLNLNLRVANKEGTNAKDYKISNKSLKEFLKFCGFESHTKAKDKIIPLKLLECSKSNSQQLLRGLFDTDGFTSLAPDRRNSNGVKIGFTSSSIELIRQVRSFLLINDIITSTNVCFHGGESDFGGKIYECNKAWSILIMGFENVKEFKDNIGFKIKRKQDNLSIINKAKYQDGQFSNYIPYIGEYLTKHLNKKSIRRRKEGIKLSFRKNTSRRLANLITEFVEEKHANKIKKLTDENLFYDYVKNVEEGFEKTVDLQVENEHCYVSDGIINHNSFSCGIFAVLDAIFNQGIEIGILSPSFRQCLSPDAILKTKEGIKQLKDIKVGDYVFARYNWQKVLNKWDNPISEGIKIRTKNGLSLSGKIGHKILIFLPSLNEYRYEEIQNLKTGTIIPSNLASSLEPNYFHDEITSIVKCNDLKTIDIEVENEHCYWGSGFINHNSKQIFRKIEDIASKPEAVYLNQVIGGRGGISRNNDEWIMNVGASTIRALPLGCLKGDTNIFYENGLREIADDFDVHESGEWINKSEKVWSNNDFELSDKKFYHGMAETKKITSDKGYEIEGTLNHRIKVLYPDGIIRWKHFEDIKDGDYVLIDRSKKQLPNKSKITSNQAYFCGAMVGDGSWVNKYYLQFTNTDEDFADKIKNITKYDWKLYDDRHYYALGKDNTKEFRDFWEVDCLYSHEKYIPRKILSSGNECISKFLSGLFDADGHCQVSTAKGGVAVTIGYTTTSEKLAKQIQQCLLIFGIISKVKNRQRQINGNCKKTPKKIWEILITGKDARIFCSEVGFGISRKQNKLEKAISQQKRDVSCLDGIPYIKNDVYNFVKNNKPTNQKYKNSCSPYKINKKKIITFDFLSKILERYESYECSFIQKLKSFNNDNYYFDKIVSVEDSQCETFDISVPNNNTYCANGFVSHNSGEKLRGFRFHRIIIDEMLLMPERIYNEVILPFLAVSENPDEQEEIAAWEDKLIAQGKMKEEDRYTWPNNKLIALSSASYQFEYLYEFYQIYEKLITEKDDNTTPGSNPASRAIIHLAYDVAPRKLYDENLLKQSKATMSQSQFDREFGAVFTDESSGYFKVSKMKECIIPYGDNPSVEVQGDPNEEYIVSMDPSWAENDSSDNFALHVYKLHPKTRTSTVVHSYALAGARMKEHMKYLLYILQNFNVVALIGDYMGSVTFLNGCNESKLFKDAGIELKFLEAKFDKPEEYKEQILEAQKQYNKEDYKFCYLQNPSTGYIRQGNQYLQSCYDHKRVRFAAEAVDDAFNSQIAKRINGFDKIKYREKFGDEDGRGYAEDMKNIDAKMVDFVEHQKDMLSLIRAECSVIEIKTSSQGHQTFDLPATLKKTTGPKKARKDSYSAMVLGTWMVKIYYDLMFTEKQKVETFMPRFIK